MAQEKDLHVTTNPTSSLCFGPCCWGVYLLAKQALYFPSSALTLARAAPLALTLTPALVILQPAPRSSTLKSCLEETAQIEMNSKMDALRAELQVALISTD